MQSFNLSFSGRLFICPSILNDSLAGKSNLGCMFLAFITLNIFYHSLLAYSVSVEKSAEILIGTPLYITDFLSFAAFEVLSLSLNFAILIMMCLGMGLFRFILIGILCASWTCILFSFTRLGKFSAIICSNRFSIPLSHSFPCGSPMIWVLLCLVLSQMFLRFSSFLLSLFSFSFSLCVDTVILSSNLLFTGDPL